MTKVNTCLKLIFTIFNIFFAIVGAAIIVLALLSQSVTHYNAAELEGRTTGLVLLYVVGAITMIISILGAYGAHKENKGCMIAFLVCMVIGTLLLFRAGIMASFIRPQMDSLLEQKFREFLPLNDAPEEAQTLANTMQQSFHCCGLFSYQDWSNEIPDSCLCNEQEEMDGMCQTVGYRDTMVGSRQQKVIYSQTCFPIFMSYFDLGMAIVIGVLLSLATLALLGLILSSIIIHQLRHPNRATVVLSVPAIFAPSLPKYQELQNSPPNYAEMQNPPPKYQELQNPSHY